MGEIFRTLNPATEELEAEFPLHDERKVEAVVAKAYGAFTKWRRQPVEERAALLQVVAAKLLERRDHYALLMTREMSKPISQSRAEVDKCALACRYYAERAAGFLESELLENPRQRGEVAYAPLGVVLAIMPWNFPFWQVIRFAAPNLVAGNVGILKHAPNVPQCALALEQLFVDAGFPEGVFQNLFVTPQTLARLIGDRRVAGVTLTGSTRAGRAVAEVAGRHLKKSVLELGGSDPYLILADADLDLAAESCAEARLLNSGQSCIAGKRFIVVEEVADAFLERFEERLAARTIGDPSNEATAIGPLARADLRDALKGQVERSLAAGAHMLLGNADLPSKGFYYPPTILTGVSPGMPAFDEELFGPVAAVIRADGEEHAIALANRSTYGLGGGIFSRNESRARKLAREELETGSVAINGFVRSDPDFPFGGIKDSGYGRELGRAGILEFVNHKAIAWSSTQASRLRNLASIE